MVLPALLSDPFALQITIIVLYVIGFIATVILFAVASENTTGPTIRSWGQKLSMVGLSFLWPILISFLFLWGLFERIFNR